MRIAYLVNQYPKISHTFIRREILAVESEGCAVARYSLRRSQDQLLDPLDREEASKTKVVLDGGPVGLLLAVAFLALTRPVRFLRAVLLGVRLGHRSDRGLLRHAIYLAEACVLVRWFVRDKIDHVHAHFGTNSTTVAMLSQELGGPSYSFTAHGPEEFDSAQLLGITRKIERSAFVAAISSFGRSQLFRRCSMPHWPKVDIIRCGVDDSFLTPAPAPLPAQRRLVSIGRLSNEKGQILLVEAMARLRQGGRNAELVLIGDGPLRQELEAAIARNGLETQVRILGWADSATILRMLDESCALVLPSFAEGLPVVIMEAMARARPVLSTYVAGIPELVVPGRNGWLIPAGSVEDLADAMCKVLDTPLEQLTQMGMRGREDVSRQHDVRLLGRKIVSRFRDVLEPGRSGAAPDREPLGNLARHQTAKL